ncbi:MAG TPA: O-antigen ligase family protein [Thermoleophilaceae bacterium]|nr:O-antigen ligase family protein [Thermoleophilaceae bacterium]
MLLALAGGAACAAGILLSPRTRPRGLVTVGLFVLLALVTTLSIEWSVTPGASWIEANRTLAYLAVFAGAVALGNLGPGAAGLVLRAVLMAATAVVVYALASRVWPDELGGIELYARIGQPFGYWNAVGVTAALAFPLALWLGSRRDGRAVVTALAFPVAGLLSVTLFLTYSRSATLAALVVVALWLVFVPLRLRTSALLVAAAAVAAPVVLWATNEPAFTEDAVAVSVRADAGPTFGLLLLALVVVLYAAGLGWLWWRAAREVPEARRTHVGRALAASLAALVVVGLAAVTLSDRGLGGTISDRWNELRDESAATTGGPERLTSAASSRSQYWELAADVFADDPLLGAGAGGYETASLHHRTGVSLARHAHSYPMQTLADLGLVGLAVSLALAAAWLVAALRAVGATPRSRLGQLFLIGRPERVDLARAPAWTPDRTAVTALFLAALAFGLQSAIDWTWFVPGPTVMALVAAGFVAGRGPAPEAAAPPEPEPRPQIDAVRIVLAGLAVLAAGAIAWSAWQPQRASELADQAIVLSGQGAFEEALDRAREAQDVDPLSLRPLFAEVHVHRRARRIDDAYAVLRRMVARHPENPLGWIALGNFELEARDDPVAAVTAMDAALYLDPMSQAAKQTLIDARTRLRELGELPPEPPLPEAAP